MHQSFVAKLDIERHSDHARANNSERSRDVFRAVFREKRHAIAALEFVLNEPVRERARARRKLLKRPTMSLFLAEDQESCLIPVLA